MIAKAVIYQASGLDIFVSEISVAVVDDDKSLRNALVGLLQVSDYSATGFESAESFLDSAEAEAVNCLITDVNMPGMSGIKLKKIMLNRRSYLPVIMITALKDKAVLEEAMESEQIFLLEKPFDSELLLECLYRIFW
ncbi:response regulator transcription factor [Rhizobium glycinendophyticum]|uniref:Response regulator n=1 Tax=Rhizobium glycinendophyticum TaxID=2589807 RepID=A0A504TX52_9HYPH|nr:response regulator [Rhizobium glycinendophyticum]TPP06050.1 response regulator [Rhizobium glycinendophyticum]